MAKNKVQLQKGYSLFEFIKDYGSEEQCEQALLSWRYPDGFCCDECGKTTYCRLKSRPRVLQCNHCRHQTTLTANTLFASTKLPLTKWFLALHLLTQTKTGIWGMELKRQLGVNYDTAWMMKHKLLQAMKEYDGQHPISGIIQLDDVYWGGERRGGKRGRGAAGKTPFVAAVALNQKGHPMQMRMSVVDGFKSRSVGNWAKHHVKKGSIILSDGLACFKAVKEAECAHLGFVVGGKLELLDHKAFNLVNTMIGNVKNSLRGSCHAIGSKHLPRHLAEYCFRFNHRFDLPAMLPKLGRTAVRTAPMPYRLLKLAELYG